METQELLNIIKESNKTDLQILLAAKEEAKRQVMEGATAANLATLEKATKVLNEFLAGPQEPFFDNRKDVLAYLKRQGYKIGKSKLYNDSDPKKGPPKLKIEPDGSVLESSVKKYISKANLYRPESEPGTEGDLSTKRQEKELEKLEEQIADLKFKREIAEGRYILKTDFEMEVAARTAVFESGIRYDYQSNVNEWALIEDPKILLEALNQSLNEKLNEFASMKTFQVIFLDEQ